MVEKSDGSPKVNLGGSRLPELKMAKFPSADEVVRQGSLATPRSAVAVDIVLVNPPTPDGALWIRTQHRVGRRTRENMVWPQVSLAQMAALLHPTYTVKIIDANAERMGWKEFEGLIGKSPTALLSDPGYCANPSKRLIRHIFSQGTWS